MQLLPPESIGSPAPAPTAPGARMPSGMALAGRELAQLAIRHDSQLPLLAPVAGSSLRVLVDEREVLPEVLAAIRGATRQVDLAMFSLSDSGAGRELVDALVERSRAGVAVHVTLDQAGSMTMLPAGSTRRMLDRMRDAGVHLAINERVDRSGLNPVDHRKLLVVDAATAITGGVNFSAKFSDWHDVMVRVDGPAAQQFAAHFLDRWVDMTGHASEGQRALVEQPLVPGSGVSAPLDARHGVAMLANLPGGELQASEHLLQNIAHAADRAWILTPTLSDPAVVTALADAARRGVDVRVAVSGPDGWIGTRALRLIGATFYRELVGAGVQVHELPGMSHAKVSLVDGIASVGSLNMTRRAMLWDHELVLASDQPEFVETIEQLVEHDLAGSTRITPEQANSRTLRAAELLRRGTGLRW